MSSNPRLSVRCAIYTRKSSEEGLEMSFNSLDAQREACQAFIASQRQEGWKALSDLYDDGGFSGGSMERPGLKRLLEDVENGQVDTIVVYKVDRLTRSLADFAKIVEALDARGVSFVSVTQQFNTTTSMGRLTLNVLLSFAQFEREVTGERIRDKIAASKRKGMWMGGRPPLGYDVKNRKLVVNQQEARLVNDLYRRYLEFGSVSKLKAYLDQQGIKSKIRVSVRGNHSGGASFFPGALYLILQNPIYLGEVRHRNDVYRGEHEAIIRRDLWDQVQAKLRSANQGRRNGIKANCSSLLVGLIQDTAGNRFNSSHTVKNGKRYRYYFWRATAQGSDKQSKVIRLPAYDIERQVSLRLQSFLQSPNDVMNGLALPGDRPELTHKLILAARKQAEEWLTAPPAAVRDFVRRVVRRVVVDAEKIDVETSRSELRASFTDNQVGTSSRAVLQGQEASSDDSIRLSVEARLKRCGGEMRLVVSPDSPRPQDIPPLVRAAVRAHSWREGVLAGEDPDRTVAAKRLDLNEEYLRRVLGCAFLAPDILEAILDGRQPADLTVKTLSRRHLPLDWAKQRTQLGFPPTRVTEPDKPEIPLNRAASPA
jgi:site-specific DNA recombinase